MLGLDAIVENVPESELIEVMNHIGYEIISKEESHQSNGKVLTRLDFKISWLPTNMQTPNLCNS